MTDNTPDQGFTPNPVPHVHHYVLKGSGLSCWAECDVLVFASSGKPTVPAVLPIVEAFYRLPEHGVGGPLHIVLDDSNVDDSHVIYCRECALDPEFWANGGKVNQPAVFLCDVLLAMSKTQRRKLSAMNRETRYNDLTEAEFWEIAKNLTTPCREKLAGDNGPIVGSRAKVLAAIEASA